MTPVIQSWVKFTLGWLHVFNFVQNCTDPSLSVTDYVQIVVSVPLNKIVVIDNVDSELWTMLNFFQIVVNVQLCSSLCRCSTDKSFSVFRWHCSTSTKSLSVTDNYLSVVQFCSNLCQLTKLNIVNGTVEVAGLHIRLSLLRASWQGLFLHHW